MSAGIRSGVNWMRLKTRWRICASGLDEQRLGQTRHAGDQAMAAGEERDQHLIDHRVLADDDLADLAEDALAARARRASATCRLRFPSSLTVVFPWSSLNDALTSSMGQRINDFVDFHPIRLRREFA